MSNESEHNAFIRWKHTKIGRLSWAIITGIIAYVFTSLAIDSGTLWQWALAILFTGDALYNLLQLLRKFTNHDSNHPKQA